MEYASMPVSETTMKEPTARLRWHVGHITGERVLQQAWNITTYHSGLPVRVDVEWREIPDSDW